MIHRLIGAVVLLMWGYVVTHLEQTLAAVALAMKYPVQKSGTGVAVILMMPLVSVALLWFPNFFADRFSPKTGINHDPFLDTNFWLLAGYFALFVSLVLMALFHSA